MGNTGASVASTATGTSGSPNGSSAFFSSDSPSGSPTTASRGGSGGEGAGKPGKGLGKRRRSTTTIAATPAPMEARGGASASSLEAALLVREPPIVVDYFEMSAYAQPSLTEGPQQAENLPQRPQVGDDGEPEPPQFNCAMAPSSSSVSPRPLSLSASAHAALAKWLGKDPEAVDDIIDDALSQPATAAPPPAVVGLRSSALADAEARRGSVGKEKGGGSSGAGGDQRV